jgi:endogenous inhibitor of DNA gyrase (YacG/DUF329 family)
MKKTCPICGKTFETNYPQRVYCGTSCSEAGLKAKHQAAYQKYYEANKERLAEKYREHRKAYYLKHKEEISKKRAERYKRIRKAIQQRYCQECGREIQRESGRYKYCSIECYKTASKRKCLEQYHAKRKERESNG